MQRFRWDQDHEIFLAAIDAEHRDLFRSADQLDRAIAEGAPSVEIKHHLASLIQHAEDHFSHEEWLMQSVAYPAYGWHKQQHETARRRFRLFVPMIEGGDQEAAELFLDFLSGWLQDHTSVTDRMMGAFVRNYERSHGVATTGNWARPAGRTNSTAPVEGPYPRTLRNCSACGDYTPHEMRPDGVVCLKCSERSVRAELDRD